MRFLSHHVADELEIVPSRSRFLRQQPVSQRRNLRRSRFFLLFHHFPVAPGAIMCSSACFCTSRSARFSLWFSFTLILASACAPILASSNAAFCGPLACCCARRCLSSAVIGSMISYWYGKPVEWNSDSSSAA